MLFQRNTTPKLRRTVQLVEASQSHCFWFFFKKEQYCFKERKILHPDFGEQFNQLKPRRAMVFGSFFKKNNIVSKKRNTAPKVRRSRPWGGLAPKRLE
jgi:hypothetical protein